MRRKSKGQSAQSKAGNKTIYIVIPFLGNDDDGEGDDDELHHIMYKGNQNFIQVEFFLYFVRELAHVIGHSQQAPGNKKDDQGAQYIADCSLPGLPDGQIIKGNKKTKPDKKDPQGPPQGFEHLGPEVQPIFAG